MSSNCGCEPDHGQVVRRWRAGHESNFQVRGPNHIVIREKDQLLHLGVVVDAGPGYVRNKGLAWLCPEELDDTKRGFYEGPGQLLDLHYYYSQEMRQAITDACREKSLKEPELRAKETSDFVAGLFPCDNCHNHCLYLYKGRTCPHLTSLCSKCATNAGSSQTRNDHCIRCLALAQSCRSRFWYMGIGH